MSSARIQTPRRIAELDALRAIVALDVVFHHVFKLWREPLQARLSARVFEICDWIQAQNHRAVMTFFVLSGFTIAMAIRSNPPINGASVRQYLVRRATRIVPLYYCSLAWTAAMGLLYGFNRPEFSLGTLLGNMLFLQTSAVSKGNWFAPFGLNGPYWSLSYEVAYYLVLPIALMLGNAFKLRQQTFSIMLVLAGLSALLVGLAANQFAPTPFSAFAIFWIVWLVGFAAYDARPDIATLSAVLLPAVLTIGGAVMLARQGVRSDTLDAVRDGTVIASAFAVAAIWRGWASTKPMMRLRRLLIALFERVGRGSYALYLLHYPLLLAAKALPWPRGSEATGVVASCLLLAAFITIFCPWFERMSLVIPRELLRQRGAVS